MDANRLSKYLAELELDPSQPPDGERWRAFLERVAHDSVDDRLVQRERYLEAVVQMQARLLTTREDHLGAFNHALEPLGQASGASRVYLFENHERAEDGMLLMSQRAEWCAPGVQPELDNPALQDLPYDEFFPVWSRELKAGRRVERLASEFDEMEREMLAPQQIFSLLVLPILVDGEFDGFIGFDNYVSETPWSQLEINLLSSAASQIGIILAQRRAQSALRKAHSDIAAARDRALEANRAKSIFLAKISHELRTPLNAIIGYSEILLEAPEELTEAQRINDIQRIQSAGKHLLAIINDLLDLSRAEAEKLTLRISPIELGPLLEELTSATHHLAKRNGNQLITHIPPASQLGALTSDRTRLHQVLLNLLSNACKYTSNGQVTFSVLPSAHTVEFRVEDTGIGIPAEQLEHIFDAFAQVDNSTTRVYEGTGLGLPISKHLSRLLGAQIAVTSLPGHGSCFTLTLPRFAHHIDE